MSVKSRRIVSVGVRYSTRCYVISYSASSFDLGHIEHIY